MSSGIAAVAISETAAIAAALTGVVNGPATSPTIARIGSNLQSQMLSFMVLRMPQPGHAGKPPGTRADFRWLAFRLPFGSTLDIADERCR